MIFEHISTGLQVVVHIQENLDQVETLAGDCISFVRSKEMITESGQTCLPNRKDSEELRMIDVLTSKGRLTLVRVE